MLLFVLFFIFLVLGGGTISDAASDTGRIVLAGSKAVGKSDLKNFVLTGKRGSGSETVLKTWDEYDDFAGTVIELECGSWTFVLEAKYLSGKSYVYNGKAISEIKPGVDTTVSFVLRNQGFPVSEAGVTDVLLSNGYACQSGDSISVASAVGVVISASGGGRLALMKLSGGTYMIGGSNSTYGALRVQVEEAGCRFPTMAEHPVVLSKFSELGIVRPTSGHFASSTMSGTSGQCFFLGNPDSSAGNSGSYMGTGDAYVLELYAVAVKDF